MALTTLRLAHGSLTHHSVRGVQYACGDYTALLGAHVIQASITASPTPTTMPKSFMKTLKQEEIDGRFHRGADEARRAIGASIEGIYNRQRLHSALDYRPPADFEANGAHHDLSLAPLSHRKGAVHQSLLGIATILT